MINVLSLHGAGKSDKNRVSYLAESLIKSNIKIHSFDFIGFGKSNIDITKSSLQIRQQQSELSVSKFRLKEPLNIIGSSMGAYNAVKMLEKYSVSNLFCPGFYTPKSFDINFGENFTKIIRQPNSWVDSDAFEALEKYTGNLFVCIGEKDEIIPTMLIEKIFAVSKNTKQKSLLKIEGATHSLHTFLANNPSQAKSVVDKIRYFLKY